MIQMLNCAHDMDYQVTREPQAHQPSADAALTVDRP
jgi:hypothetical protein